MQGPLDFPSLSQWRSSDAPRTVLGAILNHRQAYDALRPAMDQAPYKAPPASPVLYIKPANTYAADGDPILVPADLTHVEVNACLGVVIGKPASRLEAADALNHVRGYRIVAELSAPHDQYFRPAIKQRCRDGFCPMGPVLPADAIASPDQLRIALRVDGVPVQESSTRDLRLGVAELIAAVTAFMRLEAGDVLLIGGAPQAPRLTAGQRYEIEIEGLGRLSNPLQRA